ncbi:hypothetical protein FHS59_003606 [Algoriphagus iocasae]|uniref:Uncharacterized protein n=1 Tax=Algoriphagus iocasae TaxID=1836499 RepID=A0A841MM43_9BACT|nr:hypothetical protein [Algoriphagus iocasae]
MFEETEGEGQKFKVESLKFKEEARGWRLDLIKNLELEIKNTPVRSNISIAKVFNTRSNDIIVYQRWPGIVIRRRKYYASKMWMNAGQSSFLRKKKREWKSEV